MPATKTRRLAGFRFEDRTPRPATVLPRMDIAVFVGFAARGPLHLPVAIENPARFVDVFGADLPLAWDRRLRSMQSAHLAASVRAFFANGGVRCWVIRVADEDTVETDTCALPGVLTVAEDGTLAPSHAMARSPGAWSDDLVTATALRVRALGTVLHPWTSATALQISHDAMNPVAAGAVLRLTSDDGHVAFLPVASVEVSDDPDLPVTQSIDGLAAPIWFREARHMPDPGVGTITWNENAQARPPISAEIETWPDAADENHAILRTTTSDATLPPPGTWARFTPEIATAGAHETWLRTTIHRAAHSSDSPPLVVPAFEGEAWTRIDPPATPNALGPFAIEIVTIDLRVTESARVIHRLSDLGLAPGHPRHWRDLPDDATSFGDSQPTESTSAPRLWAEVASPRFPLAAQPLPRSFCLPLGVTALGADAILAGHSARARLEREGLATFSAELFLDPEFVDKGTNTISGHADFIRYQVGSPRRLRGIHAALAIDEATILCVPDAVHRGWEEVPATIIADAVEESSPPLRPEWWQHLPCDPRRELPAAEHPAYGAFLPCGLRELPAPVLTRVDEDDTSGNFELQWTSELGADAIFSLEEATAADFSGAVEIARTHDRFTRLTDREPGVYYYRVRVIEGPDTSNWSDGVRVIVSPASRVAMIEEAAYDSSAWLAIERAAIRLCAARADIALLAAMPGHFRAKDALALGAELKSPTARVVTVHQRASTALGFGEAHAFSYAALFHPWIVGLDETGGVRAYPPDAFTAGVHARRALLRGAWIAAANEALQGAVALTPDIPPAQRTAFLLAQINLLRGEPPGILCLSQDTLAEDELLRPMNVRRLLILLRRLALRLGATYVFEPNDAGFRRLVQQAFESLLGDMHRRGAFAGRSAAESYQVNCGEDVNPFVSVDQGRFIVELKVAPSLPMTFITIRLVQTGERAVVAELT